MPPLRATPQTNRRTARARKRREKYEANPSRKGAAVRAIRARCLIARLKERIGRRKEAIAEASAKIRALRKLRKRRMDSFAEADTAAFLAPPGRYGVLGFGAGVLAVVVVTAILTGSEGREPGWMTSMALGEGRLALALLVVIAFAALTLVLCAVLILHVLHAAIVRSQRPRLRSTFDRAMAGWAFGVLATGLLGLDTIEHSSLGDFLDPGFDSQRVTHTFAVALILVAVANSVLLKEGEDRSHPPRHRLGMVGQSALLAIGIPVTAGYVALCAHLLALLPSDLLSGFQIGRPPYGATSVVIVTVAALALPLVVVWRGLVRNLKESVEPSSKGGQATEDRGA